jgi:hypothetical protein
MSTATYIFTDTSATKAVTFYYEIRAVDGTSLISNSVPVVGISIDDIPPGPPTGILAWIQTTNADFEAGTGISINTTCSSGDVKLTSTTGACGSSVGQYSMTQVPYSYEGTTGGTQSGCDDCRFSFALPFVFPFGLNNYSQVSVGSNGYVSFSDLGGSICPDLATNRLIAPWSRDLYQSGGYSGLYFRAQSKTNPDRVVFEWYTTTCCSSNGRNLIEAIIYPDGTVKKKAVVKAVIVRTRNDTRYYSIWTEREDMHI